MAQCSVYITRTETKYNGGNNCVSVSSFHLLAGFTTVGADVAPVVRQWTAALMICIVSLPPISFSSENNRGEKTVEKVTRQVSETTYIFYHTAGMWTGPDHRLKCTACTGSSGTTMIPLEPENDSIVVVFSDKQTSIQKLGYHKHTGQEYIRTSMARHLGWKVERQESQQRSLPP